MKHSRRETLPATNSRSKVAPGRCSIGVAFQLICQGGVRTSVVDKDVDVPWTCLDLLESLLNRFVTSEIDLDRFNGASRLWTFFVQELDGKLGLLGRTTAEKKAVGFVGLE